MDESSSKKIKRFCWAFVIGTFIVTMTFSAMTMSNYNEIALAKHLTTVELEMVPILTYNDVNKTDIEDIQLEVQFTFTNPSDMALSVWTLSYLAYLQDTPVEAGTNSSRGLDDLRMQGEDTVTFYYELASVYEFFTSETIHIPPNSNITELWTLNVSDDDIEVVDYGL